MSRKIRIARIGQPAWANIAAMKAAAEDRPRRPAPEQPAVLPEKPDASTHLAGGGASGGMLAFIDLLPEAAEFDDRLHKLRRAALRDVDAMMAERDRQRQLARRSRR